jgi:hypothetical protein
VDPVRSFANQLRACEEHGAGMDASMMRRVRVGVGALRACDAYQIVHLPADEAIIVSDRAYEQAKVVVNVRRRVPGAAR